MNTDEHRSSNMQGSINMAVTKTGHIFFVPFVSFVVNASGFFNPCLSVFICGPTLLQDCRES